MVTLDVVTTENKKAGTVDLSAAVFEAQVKPDLFHAEVTRQLAARRRGTHSTKNRAAVSGGGSKPWRQKGTGRARAGYRQSPVWRGGSVVFGPRPRKYGGKINRKIAGLAFRRAFSEKLAAGEVKVLDELVLDAGKTALFAGVLKSLEIDGPALFVLDKIERNVALASRNIQGIDVVRAADLSVYALLSHPVVVASKAAMEQITARMQAGNGAKKKAPAAEAEESK